MSIRSRCLLAVFLPLLIAMAPVERDWSETLRTDAQAIHDTLAASHPGPVNPDDPGFASRNDEQLRLALQRAEIADSFADYFFALRGYVAAFDDGHLNFGVYGATPSDTHWPGFLTHYEPDGEQRVVTRTDDAPVPLGARLLSCDARPAEKLAQAKLGRFIGRWSLLSQRLTFGTMLFADQGNPYVDRPARCTFEVAGQRREVALSWQPIDNNELVGRLRQLGTQPPRELGARVLADGTRWISLSSFDAHPESPSGRALPPLIESLRAERTALAAAPAIVLDLRGNGGGSSDWPRQIADAIWGSAVRARLPADDVRVDWRVSPANLAAIRASRDRQLAGGGLSPEMRRWFDRVTSGLEAALARGETLWREREESSGPNQQEAANGTDENRLNGPVYVLTDAGCASACLDAVDLWRALGAIHVGLTTSADTLYMDVRSERLPSGLGELVLPMKVYRGRARGSNEPVVPVHAYPGDIGDTAALERWIAALPERRR